MWIIRILRYVLLAGFAVVLARSVTAFMSALFGARPRPKGLCPKCGGTGWVAVDATTQRACDCGVLPEETQGRILKPPGR